MNITNLISQVDSLVKRIHNENESIALAADHYPRSLPACSLQLSLLAAQLARRASELADAVIDQEPLPAFVSPQAAPQVAEVAA